MATTEQTIANGSLSTEGSISTTDWDQDTKLIPRLQLVDEDQKFT